MKAPVVFFVFNRAEHTRRSLAAVRQYMPDRLFVVADGPRAGHPTDETSCAEVRHIFDAIDWPCQVSRNFAPSNLGCRDRIISGLDWAFSHVDRAIILEDDCVASPDFFRFTNWLLDYHAHDERVWTISGNSYQPQHRRGDAAYYFSRYPDTGGWATWQRAWRHFQPDVPFLQTWKMSGDWKVQFAVAAEARYWSAILKRVQEGQLDSWAYPWTACCMFNHGLAATPNANLVKNIGFDAAATHTTVPIPEFAYEFTHLPSLTHPDRFQADAAADAYASGMFHRLPSLGSRLMARLRRARPAFRR